jgi:hypothetical protein
MAKKSKRRSNGAVAKAWAIFNKHPKAERKEQLEAAAHAGINPSTAKTQFQRWKNAGKAEREKKLNGNGSKKEEKKTAAE